MPDDDEFFGVPIIKVKKNHLDQLGHIINSLHEQAQTTEALRITVPVQLVEQMFRLYHTL